MRLAGIAGGIESKMGLKANAGSVANSIFDHISLQRNTIEIGIFEKKRKLCYFRQNPTDYSIDVRLQKLPFSTKYTGWN